MTDNVTLRWSASSTFTSESSVTIWARVFIYPLTDEEDVIEIKGLDRKIKKVTVDRYRIKLEIPIWSGSVNASDIANINLFKKAQYKRVYVTDTNIPNYDSTRYGSTGVNLVLDGKVSTDFENGNAKHIMAVFELVSEDAS